MLTYFKKKYTPKEKTKVYVVLGMHRSGTSLVARILSSKGINMGDNLLKPGKYNKFGYFEDIYFLRINQILLRTLGGNWYKPPLAYTGLVGFKKYIVKILNIFFLKRVYKYSKENKFWGFKDPRFTLTYGMFSKYLLNHEICLIGVFRKPGDVVSSIIKRDNMKPGNALDIWKEYNLYLLYYLKKYKGNSICIEYDDLLKNPKKIEKLINENIDGNDIKLSDFLNKKENHSLGFDISYDKQALDIYNQLINIK